jgi:hypothetical protein
MKRRIPLFPSPSRFVLFGALAVASAAWADAITLGGTVGSTSSVISTPTATASALPMGGEGSDIGEQIKKVGDLALSTNNTEGLTLTVTSGNLSKGSDAVAYKVMTVADGATAPASGDFSTDSGDSWEVDAALGASSLDLYIAYSPPAVLDPGDYAGEITLSVQDK